jgi:hypothetical protein
MHSLIIDSKGVIPEGSPPATLLSSFPGQLSFDSSVSYRSLNGLLVPTFASLRSFLVPRPSTPVPLSCIPLGAHRM